jgi:hypothetical protein
MRERSLNLRQPLLGQLRAVYLEGGAPELLRAAQARAPPRDDRPKQYRGLEGW